MDEKMDDPLDRFIPNEWRVKIYNKEDTYVYSISGWHITNENELLASNVTTVCPKCDDTGFLFGAQNWSESFMKKNGGPYYTADCDCDGAKEKRKQYRRMNNES